VEPPGPIPNPEVKRRSADDSGTIGPVKVGRRQVYARLQEIGVGLFFWACIMRLSMVLPIAMRGGNRWQRACYDGSASGVAI
jgi:hypothetical protein